MRYQLENFKENLQRLHRYLDSNDGKNLCAVFDIGTKATKLLVGPKKEPRSNQTWRASAFFNEGQLFALGADHYRGGLDELNIRDSGALEGIGYFIETYRTILQGAGMALDDMLGVGTAVFRWMTNQQEVVDYLRSRAKFRIHVLDPEEEAFLSCLSIEHTYSFGARGHQEPPGPGDVILLFDQGGGSTEISWLKPGNRLVGGHDSLDDFGTVALQELFFTLREGDERHRDPSANLNKISKQFERVNAEIGKRVQEWAGFPALKREKGKIHAYGMGTALSKLLGSGNIFSQHNRVISIADIDETLGRECRSQDSSTQQVRTLYKQFKEEEARGGKELSRVLVLLYGLPVYRELLSNFGLDHLRFAGFGLRYGAYIAVCRGLVVGESRKPVVKKRSIDVFLSHSHEDKTLAIKISEDLQKNGVTVWRDDRELKPGEIWVQKIAENLKASNSVAVILSKASIESRWVQEEVSAALEQDKHIIPIKIEECDVPLFLGTRQHADFTGDYTSGITNLLEALRKPPVKNAKP